LAQYPFEKSQEANVFKRESEKRQITQPTEKGLKIPYNKELPRNFQKLLVNSKAFDVKRLTTVSQFSTIYTVRE
jgi:hypothetical protein